MVVNVETLFKFLESAFTGPGPVLDVVVPSELQARLPQLLAAIDYAGPERFYNVATRLQSLPRSFLMGWLERALVSQPTTGYIKTEVGGKFNGTVKETAPPIL